ncbi:hypothetical protein [Streptomyces sp. NPDC000880]
MNGHTSPTATGDEIPSRPARPAGYWERIDRIVDQAPPLTNLQRARLRGIFHQPTQRKEQAA